MNQLPAGRGGGAFTAGTAKNVASDAPPVAPILADEDDVAATFDSNPLSGRRGYQTTGDPWASRPMRERGTSELERSPVDDGDPAKNQAGKVGGVDPWAPQADRANPHEPLAAGGFPSPTTGGQD